MRWFDAVLVFGVVVALGASDPVADPAGDPAGDPPIETSPSMDGRPESETVVPEDTMSARERDNAGHSRPGAG